MKDHESHVDAEQHEVDISGLNIPNACFGFSNYQHNNGNKDVNKLEPHHLAQD